MKKTLLDSQLRNSEAWGLEKRCSHNCNVARRGRQHWKPGGGQGVRIEAQRAQASVTRERSISDPHLPSPGSHWETCGPTWMEGPSCDFRHSPEGKGQTPRWLPQGQEGHGTLMSLNRLEEVRFIF